MTTQYERVTFHLDGKKKSVYLKDVVETQKYLMGTAVDKTGEVIINEEHCKHKYFLSWPIVLYRTPQFLNLKYGELEACGKSRYESINIDINEFERKEELHECRG